MYIYIHTYIHTYMHLYIDTYMHTYNALHLLPCLSCTLPFITYIRTYTHRQHTYIHTYINIYMFRERERARERERERKRERHAHTHTHARARTYIHRCIRSCIHSSIQPYVPAYIHTSMQHIHISVSLSLCIYIYAHACHSPEASVIRPHAHTKTSKHSTRNAEPGTLDPELNKTRRTFNTTSHTLTFNYDSKTLFPNTH